ncbi:MAG: beta-ketoacyl-ACP synthase III [Acidobacteriota bacterium]
MRSVITGSGIGIPPNLVTNEMLSKIMDTSDEWIRTRSGIEQRYFADDGQGSVALGLIAAEQALQTSGKSREDVDAVVFATMTPDYLFPGNGPLLQAALGLRQIPTFDVRQQCSGFLYGLDLADSLIRSGKHQCILLVGAEVHTPFMLWKNGWGMTIGQEERPITEQERAANTALRDRTVLFGDGAGAVVVEAREENGTGYLGSKLFTDGSAFECLIVKGVGFRQRPYVSVEAIESGEIVPHMEGREVYRQALSLMPEAVRQVCEEAGVAVADLDLLLVHQANLRIIEGVQKILGLSSEQVPHNIERYGNTTAGTLPILYHECREAGRIQPGMLIAFTALGSGLHWGASLYRA